MRPKRVLVKLSGEALAGPQGSGLDGGTLVALAADIAHASREGVEVGIVVGGGNFFRGVQGLNKGLDRTTADSILSCRCCSAGSFSTPAQMARIFEPLPKCPTPAKRNEKAGTRIPARAAST